MGDPFILAGEIKKFSQDITNMITQPAGKILPDTTVENAARKPMRGTPFSQIKPCRKAIMGGGDHLIFTGERGQPRL